MTNQQKLEKICRIASELKNNEQSYQDKFEELSQEILNLRDVVAGADIYSEREEAYFNGALYYLNKLCNTIEELD